MLITEDFVMLNYPKTGSSFTRTVLKQILDHRQQQRSGLARWFRNLTGKKDYEELILPNIKITGTDKPADQHGCYCQIPSEHKGKKVLSVARNPVSRLVSTYEFKGWHKWPLVPSEVLLARYPGFPDLSLEEYAAYQFDSMVHGRLGGVPPKAHVGNQTVQFIQMFFKEPERVIHQLTDAYLDSDAYLQDMGTIQFLQQERLLDDLIELLKAHGFSNEEIDIARSSPAVNVTQGRKIGFEERIPDALVRDIGEKERLLYRIYHHLGIDYRLELSR